MSDAFICRRGGIGTGGELTVNALAGVTVTAVHSTTQKTYTKTANADGVAVFKGLPEGTYNVTISDGTTTTEPVSVVVAYKAETTVAFFQATINVTYPAGSTCTCTCGDVSVTAPNTSGTWACIVPNAGTWTVTATDGECTKAVDVVIAAAGETKTVNILYDLYLYNSGDTCAAVTGGWGEAKADHGHVNWDTNSVYVYFDNSTSSGRHVNIYTNNPINLRGYSTLTFVVSDVYTELNPGLVLDVRDSVYTGTSIGSAGGYAARYNIRSDGTYALDITALNDDYYIEITAGRSNGRFHSIIIKQ